MNSILPHKISFSLWFCDLKKSFKKQGSFNPLPSHICWSSLHPPPSAKHVSCLGHSVQLPHWYKSYSKWSSPLENCRSGNEKSPLLVQELFPLAHTGILHSSMLEISSNLWNKTFSVLLQENSSKSLKLKMLGKTAEIHHMGRGSPGLRHVQQIQKQIIMLVYYSLLIIFYSLLIVYSLLTIFYSLLVMVYIFYINYLLLFIEYSSSLLSSIIRKLLYYLVLFCVM